MVKRAAKTRGHWPHRPDGVCGIMAGLKAASSGSWRNAEAGSWVEASPPFHRVVLQVGALCRSWSHGHSAGLCYLELHSPADRQALGVCILEGEVEPCLSPGSS